MKKVINENKDSSLNKIGFVLLCLVIGGWATFAVTALYKSLTVIQ